MNHYFNNIDIPFSIGGCNFHVVNIISSSIDTDIPLHTHGVNCYEIHFISNGCGRLIADGNEYDISTNTLYVTGPLCDHAQLTDKTSPMYEWCIYLRAEQNNSERSDILIDQFLSHNFSIFFYYHSCQNSCLSYRILRNRDISAPKSEADFSLSCIFYLNSTYL